MSVSDSPLPATTSDAIWHQNKAEIMTLYQNQRKTLKEVKRIMELKGFPETPLPTWETKIRDVLQLRKKAKSNYWPSIYQHILPRLENPGQKELRKRTAIYLNGSEIPWNKAWKETRRSRATALPLRQGSPSPLPFGVVIRTPSPVPGPSTSTARASQLTDGVVATHSELTAQNIAVIHDSEMARTAQIAIENHEPRTLGQYAVSVYQDCAATIPWVGLYQALQHLFQSAHPTWQLDGDLFQEQRELLASIITNRVRQTRPYELSLNTQSCFDLMPVGYPTPPRPSHDIGCRVSIFAARLQLSQFISTTIYLLSNNLHDCEDGDKGLELFCSILERDHRQIIKFLHSKLPSIRAAWDALLRYSAQSHRKNTFIILIDIGIRNAWLDSQLSVGSLLRYAVEMDCNDTVEHLVAYWGRSSSEWWTQSFDAMTSAIRKKKTECARLLVEHCDPSACTWWTVSKPCEIRSSFQNFICEINIHNDGDMRALEFLLMMGANVDEPFRWGVVPTLPPSKGLQPVSPIERYYGGQIDNWMRLTILDHLLYFNRPLYEKLAPYSRVSESDISRTGLLVALKGGTAALENYLEERLTRTPSPSWNRVHSYLELITAEQFMLREDGGGGGFVTLPGHARSIDLLALPPKSSYREIDIQIVRALVEYGVNLALPSISVGIQDLLGAVLRQLARQCTDDGLELITMLVQNGASIMGPQVQMVVEDHGFQALECLAVLVDEFPARAVLALAEAARLNNFEAVEFLLRAGVDPRSFVPGGEIAHMPESMKNSSYGVQAIAALCTENGGCASSDMIKCLAKYGARLVVTPYDSSLFDFIRHLLRYSHSDIFRRVKYAVQDLRECNQMSVLPSYLLEECVCLPTKCRHAQHTQVSEVKEVKARLDIFEYLLDQGASVSPGPCLAALICRGGSKQLVEKVVHFGADLNAYYCVREMPGHRKRTPLQASAAFGYEDLVRQLLAAGSNVNSRACGRYGQTALQAICAWDTATEEEFDRKMRVCQLLINQGADVNASPARVLGGTALQCAAQAGHLEIAALLLRKGARVNAVCWNGCLHQTALDKAVFHQRMDMVKFLLNANGLSYDRGGTGYDGALKIASWSVSRLPIADLIRRHATDNMALGLINPELLKPQEDYHIYGYVTDEEYDINRYNPDVLREDCTIDSLCTYCAGIAPD